MLNLGNKFFLNSRVDQDESSSECESSDCDEEEDEDDNVSYFGESFRTNNHITFNDSDETKRLALIFLLYEQTFLEEISIFETLC